LWDACISLGRGKDTLRLFARLYQEFCSMGFNERAAGVAKLLPPGYPLGSGIPE
jgi:hypothetical protein